MPKIQDLPRHELGRGNTALVLSEQQKAVYEKIFEFIRDVPTAFERSNLDRHITASAFVITPDHSKVLLTHHKKLERWFQLGGHCEGETNALACATREANEESGLTQLVPLSTSAVDLDIHTIPARKSEAEHDHYDLRYLFECDGQEKIVCSNESIEVAWVEIDNLEQFTQDQSVLRLRDVLAYL